MRRERSRSLVVICDVSLSWRAGASSDEPHCDTFMLVLAVSYTDSQLIGWGVAHSIFIPGIAEFKVLLIKWSVD